MTVSDATHPPSVLSNREDVARWLDGSDGLVLGVDFDGTLAPIVDDPTESTITGRARELLEKLTAHPRVLVAVVSGRELDDLVDRVGIEGPVYAGNHGLEIRVGDETLVHPEAARQQATIERLVEELRSRLEDVPGSHVEDKDLSATVHFRQGSEAAEDVVSTVESLAEGAEADVRVSSGKEIRELRPGVEWDKGTAMQLLIDRAPDGYQSLYVGDDTTDEDAFRAVQPDGVGIRVGSETDEETDAAYLVPNQGAVPQLLAWIAEYADDRWDADGSADSSYPGGWDSDALLESTFVRRDEVR